MSTTVQTHSGPVRVSIQGVVERSGERHPEVILLGYDDGNACLSLTRDDLAKLLQVIGSVETTWAPSTQRQSRLRKMRLVRPR